MMMLILTSSFFVIELVMGHISNSNALIADSFHMLSDVISLIIGLVAVSLAKKLPTNHNTFGWIRAEILGSLINSVFLLALCFSIVVDSITRFIEPNPLEHIDKMLIVGFIGLAINLIGLVIFAIQGHTHGHSHATHNHSHDTHGHSNPTFSNIVVKNEQIPVIQQKQKKKRFFQDLNIHGVFLHVLSDALGSIAVIISGLLVKYVPPLNDSNVNWKLYIDPILSVAISLFICVTTIPLVRESCLVLLEAVPRNIDLNTIKKHLFNVSGVVDINHFHIWSLNTNKLMASLHLKLNNNRSFQEIMDDINRVLHKNDIHSTTIQVDYDFKNCDGDECKKKQCC
jgi:solute carrier family 30 (zinc transporter), member 1